MLVGTFEDKNGLPRGTIRNHDGTDARSDKRLDTLRNEAAKAEEAEKKR